MNEHKFVGIIGAPYIYFEVISKDTFDRFRTEGITYTRLPVYAGLFDFRLNCLRILPNNLSSNLRRFFIGDYMNYDDVTWFGLPKEHEVHLGLVWIRISRLYILGFDFE